MSASRNLQWIFVGITSQMFSSAQRFDNNFMLLIAPALLRCGTTNDISPKVVGRHVVRCGQGNNTREVFIVNG